MTTVSFIIIARNEETTIHNVLKDLSIQDYPHNLIEVILIDGRSSDDTKKIMQIFSEENNGFSKVIVLDNPRQILPSGWNVALSSVTNTLIIRVDAHSRIPINFISQNVKCIESGEDICGGYRPNIIDQQDPWKETLLLAESSMFGSSIASYRRNSENKYVKSVFHGAYKKNVFNQVGAYNEALVRTEDNEMHYRMRKAGYKIRFDPSIISYQLTRNTLKKMLLQKYLNGYWIGKTLKICMKCFSVYHFVPMLFVLSIGCTGILSIFKQPHLSILLWILYGFTNVAMTCVAIISNNKFRMSHLLLPILFLLLHLSYGFGTLVGIARNWVKYEA
ncbi:glycosyltransferase [Paenibacillus sp. Soil766]|uniref:glycosyltransferase family 2 protein n=1 Tax=Paenibacillus sp. Soil766 TaxID=1736404 RepID=UPI0007108D7E|nr:glycosyltransferase family 2 protein [Paenibacillus sp. Soil766]KRE83812.1 glycosyltransferase [Paenibacillus sp. Soil766]